MAPLIERIDGELHAYAKADPRVKVLRTLPGVGEFAALVMVAEIGDISRFGSARKLASWAGLTPGYDRSASYWTGPGRGWLAELDLPAASREIVTDCLAVIDGRRPATVGGGLVPAMREPLDDKGLAYPDTPDDAAENVTNLWEADLADTTELVCGRVDPGRWNDASLRWLVDPARLPYEPANGVHIGMSDVARFRATVEMFQQLDDRYGCGHARQALIQYLRTDAERLLHGKYTEGVGRALFSSVAEATLLGAWMSYDAAPASRLAQKYFIQALSLAQAGDDRLLGASILDAMSHQATYRPIP